jgi:hypothetical protein
MKKGLTSDLLKANFKEFDLLKGKKTGFYTDTPENRKLGRVGQKYVKDKSERTEREVERVDSDVMRQINGATTNATASGGGYAKWSKVGQNTWKNQKTNEKVTSQELYRRIGDFNDFKVDDPIMDSRKKAKAAFESIASSHLKDDYGNPNVKRDASFIREKYKLDDEGVRAFYSEAAKYWSSGDKDRALETSRAKRDAQRLDALQTEIIELVDKPDSGKKELDQLDKVLNEAFGKKFVEYDKGKNLLAGGTFAQVVPMLLNEGIISNVDVRRAVGKYQEFLQNETIKQAAPLAKELDKWQARIIDTVDKPGQGKKELDQLDALLNKEFGRKFVEWDKDKNMLAGASFSQVVPMLIKENLIGIKELRSAIGAYANFHKQVS